MGIIKNVANKVKDTYQKVDKRLGGRLLGRCSSDKESDEKCE